MIKLAITGASGRMAKNLIAAIKDNPKVQLGAAIEHSQSAFLGLDAGEVSGTGKSGVIITDNIQNVLSDFDVLIDFTRPEGSLTYLKYCETHHKKIVIGTTGFSDDEKQLIQKASQSIPIVFAANYSVGVNVLLKLLEKTAAIMGDYTDIEIIEAHHKHKVDAPSGTALAMGESIAKALNWNLADHAVYAREGYTGERKENTIGFSTIRAGDIVGEHTALFADTGERIEISHKASSRMTFANGAVRAAIWLTDQPNGLYNMQDVLALNEL